MKWKKRLVLTVALMVVSWAQGVNGEAIDWKTERYSHYSRGEEVADIVKDLMAFQGIPVVVSSKIKGEVNLRFDNLPPQEALDRLARLYQLTWYYDGHALFVYRMDETKTATLKMVNLPVADFTELLKRLGIYDPRFSWKVSESDGFIYFSGPPRYVTLVMETARAMDIQSPASAGTVVYRWKDEGGVVNFSSSPPNTEEYPTYEVVNLETGSVMVRAPRR